MVENIAELCQLERDTLNCIVQQGAFARLGELQNAAKRALALLPKQGGPMNFNLGFKLNIRLRADVKEKRIERRIDIGARVDQATNKRNISNASYSLILCKGAEPARSPLIRKFHFDYEPIGYRNSNEPKPSVHLQICGKLSPAHRDAGYLDRHLSSWYPGFEKPRIPLPPVSLALLLNWIFVEFQSDPASHPILMADRWRNIVAEAERKVLLPYYRDAVKFLGAATNDKKRFLQNRLYEMSSD
ncbi:hypothetical protein [Variovorax sp. EBFNA2]|uniref:hypothetical protein n=1 Tax=Variovorax sp. EBFNA2 TaxID=3342097 RepID=UPI0029BFBD79|nr:hypothetical protein [Variovorax boronicumulans]WPG38514.1 hypothetical protein RZE79_04045 [Variovorax boronicumulans]